MRNRLLWAMVVANVALLSAVRAAAPEASEAKNVQTLSAIYGVTLTQLDQQWQEGIQHGNL